MAAPHHHPHHEPHPNRAGQSGNDISQLFHLRCNCSWWHRQVSIRVTTLDVDLRRMDANSGPAFTGPRCDANRAYSLLCAVSLITLMAALLPAIQVGRGMADTASPMGHFLYMCMAWMGTPAASPLYGAACL